MRDNPNRARTIAGIAAAGSATTGIGSLFAALFLFANGDYLETGICLVAAALAFGLLSNAIFRD
jgi:hypothetical protein